MRTLILTIAIALILAGLMMFREALACGDIVRPVPPNPIIREV